MIFASFAIAQRQMSTAVPWISGNDTIPNVTHQDTIQWQGTVSGLNWPATWNTMTNYFSAAEKVAEDTQVYILADETYWTWFQMVRFRIDCMGSVLTSKPVTIGSTSGAVTLFLQADTITVGDTTKTLYLGRVGGI